MNDKDLDRYITGENDPNAPFNQPDSEPQKSISDIIDDFAMLEENDPNGELDLIPELLSEIMREINFLRDYAKANENQYLLKRLNSIYNKL